MPFPTDSRALVRGAPGGYSQSSARRWFASHVGGDVVFECVFEKQALWAPYRSLESGCAVGCGFLGAVSTYFVWTQQDRS